MSFYSVVGRLAVAVALKIGLAVAQPAVAANSPSGSPAASPSLWKAIRAGFQSQASVIGQD